MAANDGWLPQEKWKFAEGALALPGHSQAVSGELGMSQIFGKTLRRIGNERSTRVYYGAKETGEEQGSEGEDDEQQTR